MNVRYASEMRTQYKKNETGTTSIPIGEAQIQQIPLGNFLSYTLKECNSTITNEAVKQIAAATAKDAYVGDIYLFTQPKCNSIMQTVATMFIKSHYRIKVHTIGVQIHVETIETTLIPIRDGDKKDMEKLSLMQAIKEEAMSVEQSPKKGVRTVFVNRMFVQNQLPTFRLTTMDLATTVDAVREEKEKLQIQMEHQLWKDNELTYVPTFALKQLRLWLIDRLVANSYETTGTTTDMFITLLSQLEGNRRAKDKQLFITSEPNAGKTTLIKLIQSVCRKVDKSHKGK